MPIFIELQLIAKEEAAQVQLLASQLRRVFPLRHKASLENKRQRRHQRPDRTSPKKRA